MREETKRKNSLDERLEKIKERGEKETALALMLEEAPKAECKKGGKTLLNTAG